MTELDPDFGYALGMLAALVVALAALTFYRTLVRARSEVADAVRAKDVRHTVSDETEADINRTIQGAIMISRGEWQPVAEVQTELAADLPRVRCQTAEISLVVCNMLVQCARGAPSGLKAKSLITVKTGRVEDWAEIRIGNASGTVTPELRQQLFTPGPGAAKSPHGLTLAHDIIVRKHHGTISLDAEPGTGMTFVIRLPIDTPAEADVDVTSTSTFAA